jgi:hypothetical protein
MDVKQEIEIIILKLIRLRDSFDFIKELDIDEKTKEQVWAQKEEEFIQAKNDLSKIVKLKEEVKDGMDTSDTGSTPNDSGDRVVTGEGTEAS